VLAVRNPGQAAVGPAFGWACLQLSRARASGATVSLVLASVSPILDPVAAVFAAVADLLEAVERPADPTDITPVFTPVAPIFTAIATILSAIADILQPVTRQSVVWLLGLRRRRPQRYRDERDCHNASDTSHRVTSLGNSIG
jgi:hypothetical protein